MTTTTSTFDATRVGRFAIRREIDLDTMTATIVGIPDSVPQWLVKACEDAMSEAQDRNMSTQRETVVDYHPAQADLIGASAVFYQVIDGTTCYYYEAGVTANGKAYGEGI